MQMLRSFITSFIALAVFAAPMMCCCTGVMGLAKTAEAQTATAPESPCGHCPSEESSSAPANQDKAPDPGHSDGCDCDKTLIATSFSAELKLFTPVELPTLPFIAAIPAEPFYQGDIKTVPMLPVEPPGLALRERLSLLCVLRI